jgi:hypothetical protein
MMRGRGDLVQKQVGRAKDQRADEIVQGPVMGSVHPDQLIMAGKTAVSMGATHLGVVEHDMRFPSDAFRRLLAHKKPIIGANYRQRQQNQWTTIKDNTTFLSSRNRTGIEPVLTVGMGVILIDLDILPRLHSPWWSAPFIVEVGRHIGVDTYFGRNAAHVGIQSWVDHDLSQEIGHIAGDIELWCDKLVYTQTGETVAASWD